MMDFFINLIVNSNFLITFADNYVLANYCI